MTITVPGVRSNKLVSMDIDQLRGWAVFMDKAMIASLIVTILAVVTLGVTTWLSFRFGGAVRAHEQAAVERYKGMESHSAQLEQDIASTRERAAALEREVSAARERAAALDREVSSARERAMAFEQAARDANARAARADRESAAAAEKAAAPAPAPAQPPPPLDATKIQQRLADLGRLVRDATARAVDATRGKAAEPPRQVQEESTPESAAASRNEPPSPVVVALRKYAGINAAVFVLEKVPDAPPAGSTISAWLNDAGWASDTWTWTGVAGILGVVVLVKEGSDTATQDAAAALVEALRTAGFNAAKADWPADWRRHRGVLDGPQTPAPTDAPIRIVIGAKSRGQG
ncbi:MAG: hypothetical protein U1E60_02840 [Reyranellaceae bacterium]